MANATQITTGKVRFSYCSLFTPRAAQEGGQLKYSVTLLIPKSDKNTLAKIKAAIEAAKVQYIQRNAGKKLPSNLKDTMHDGDGERPNGGDFRRAYSGVDTILRCVAYGQMGGASGTNAKSSTE